MKKKYEVLFYIDKLSTKKDQNDPSKMVFSTKELASHLNIQRSNLSAILNELVRENKLEKIAGRPVLYKIHNKLDEDDSIFNQLIGFNGSLAKSIQDIKSTLLYPGKKPVILLSGESGTGKSLLAKKIYEFSKEKGLINENGQLVKLNCKYFMNDETMIKNLFIDYGKAALEKAKNGMIYFDNVHLIPEKYKSIIYDLIEMSSLKENNFMVVLSSDCFNENDLKSNALDNISIKIDLPSLDKRGLVERMELVQGCFKKEARKIDKSIVIEPETLECLLLYHCKNNIKQLVNDISSACSHAFLKNLDNNSNVYVYLDDFPIYVKKGFIFYKFMSNIYNFYLYLGSVLAPCGNNATFMLSIEPLFNSFATLNASSKVLTTCIFVFLNLSAGISVTNIILYLSAVSEKSNPTNPPIEKSALNALSLSSIFVNLTI